MSSYSYTPTAKRGFTDGKNNDRNILCVILEGRTWRTGPIPHPLSVNFCYVSPISREVTLRSMKMTTYQEIDLIFLSGENGVSRKMSMCVRIHNVVHFL